MQVPQEHRTLLVVEDYLNQVEGRRLAADPQLHQTPPEHLAPAEPKLWRPLVEDLRQSQVPQEPQVQLRALQELLPI